MKVRVNFTVEFDADKYREVHSLAGKPLTNKQIREQVQNSAMSRIMYGLGDDGIEVTEAIHNN